MADPAVRVSLPARLSEAAGACLWDLLGPYQEIEDGERAHLIFYPFRHGAGYVEEETILAALPEAARPAAVVERVLVPGGWQESWKRHFQPVHIAALYVRPPWEPASTDPEDRDVVLTPGLAFGTGLHPTTRGILRLLQDRGTGGGSPLVDVGTGSGILAISAARLGYRPIRAVDNDPQAVGSARANISANGVDVEVLCADVAELPLEWFQKATVLANITLEPVVALLDRLSGRAFRSDSEVERLLVAGILSGGQERSLDAHMERAGLRAVTRLYEREWVSLDLRPDRGISQAVSSA